MSLNDWILWWLTWVCELRRSVQELLYLLSSYIFHFIILLLLFWLTMIGLWEGKITKGASDNNSCNAIWNCTKLKNGNENWWWKQLKTLDYNWKVLASFSLRLHGSMASRRSFNLLQVILKFWIHVSLNSLIRILDRSEVSPLFFPPVDAVVTAGVKTDGFSILLKVSQEVFFKFSLNCCLSSIKVEEK